MSWTLSNGSEERTLVSWGIVEPVLSRQTFAADELSFVQPLADVFSAPTFPYGTTLTLKFDGEVRFIGQVRRTPSYGSVRGEHRGYLVANAWWDLERTIYQQPRCLWDPNTTYVSYYSTNTSHVVIGQTPLGGFFVTTTAAILDVLLYAFSAQVPLVPGAILGGIEFQLQEAMNVTCAEVIKRLAALTPDAIMWADYSTGSTVFHFGRRGTLAAVSLSLSDGNQIEGFQVDVREDLVPTGVRFIYVGSMDHPTNGRRITTISEDLAGLPDVAGCIVATIELHGEGTDRQEPPPAGMAGQYYLALQTPSVEGTVITVGKECLGNVSLGKTLNLTGGVAGWASMAALVVRIVEELDDGRTTIEFGTPEVLPAQDFVDQMLFARRAKASTTLQAVRTCRIEGPDVGDDGAVPGTGGTEKDNPDAGVSPKGKEDEDRFTNSARHDIDQQEGTFELTVCEDGEEKTVRVLGRVIPS